MAAERYIKLLPFGMHPYSGSGLAISDAIHAPLPGRPNRAAQLSVLACEASKQTGSGPTARLHIYESIYLLLFLFAPLKLSWRHANQR